MGRMICMLEIVIYELFSILQFSPFCLLAPKIWLSNLSTLSLPDESYSRLSILSTLSLPDESYSRLSNLSTLTLPDESYSRLSNLSTLTLPDESYSRN
jgi:predicted DNA-binding protein